jgi:hypothetical protein
VVEKTSVGVSRGFAFAHVIDWFDVVGVRGKAPIQGASRFLRFG